MRECELGWAGLALVVAACGAPQGAAVATPAPSGEPSGATSAATAEPSVSSTVLLGEAPPSSPGSPPSFGGHPQTPGGAKTDGSSPASSARGSHTERVSQISARHVLIQWMGAQSAGPSVVRTREQALVVAQEVLRKARSGVDFARLAVEFSDEPNAGHRGGSLGRFGHGQMVKQFEDAAFALQPGEISGIVESPFGFHIIQRTE